MHGPWRVIGVVVVHTRTMAVEGGGGWCQEDGVGGDDRAEC